MRNIAKCKKCGDIIESKHRHDFVTCKCGAISIDGGIDYTRVVGEPKDYQRLDDNLNPVPALWDKD